LNGRCPSTARRPATAASRCNALGIHTSACLLIVSPVWFYLGCPPMNMRLRRFSTGPGGAVLLCASKSAFTTAGVESTTGLPRCRDGESGQETLISRRLWVIRSADNRQPHILIRAQGRACGTINLRAKYHRFDVDRLSSTVVSQRGPPSGFPPADALGTTSCHLNK
jgi:hypothetical protein